ncbi:hypothetical protein NRS6185_03783 [Bacillus subtilis]|uniref:hypothetical protein n=1 Tax=Bacillus subtilis TaxID=1423 RepID=UPI001BA0C69A|nr:hypothetical protein [Bacillus subtilis]CAF1897278.1 hypothetical protein NRS6185_03783 [Bacillus subtilis]
MAETNASASIHVLADETLGGIKREYVEVDRKAEVGDKVVIVDANVQCEEPYNNGDIFEAESLLGYSSGIQTTCHRDIFDFEYRVLEPTDIVHIDGQRYELTDRKAEVGEKVIVVDDDDSSEEFGSFRIGEVGTVESYSSDDMYYGLYANVRLSDGRDIPLYLHEFRLLVPVETAEADEPQPVDTIDAIVNLATRVADLERTIKRQKDEIDTLHKDNRTLGEELARLKEPPKNEACAPIDAPLVFVQRKIGDVFDVYQDGKRLRGIKRIRIDAAMGEVTTHDIEFVSGATEEERP